MSAPDIFDIASYVGGLIREQNAASASPAMDLSLTFITEEGATFSGPTSGGQAVRIDDHSAPPHVWARVKPRRIFSLDPYALEILELDSKTEPTPEDLDAARLLSEHVFEAPGNYPIESTMGGNVCKVMIEVQTQQYADQIVTSSQVDPQLTMTVTAPRPRPPMDTFPVGAGCGMAVAPDEPLPRVWVWQCERASGAPYVVRLLEIERDGLPTDADAAAAKVLAECILHAPASQPTAQGAWLEAERAGQRYRVHVDICAFARGALAYLSAPRD